MRKTSQDGGDSTSITSGLDNEIKKSGANKIKTKRNSFKKKVQTLSHDSDDTVIEPLLQKDKEIANRSAKILMSKIKTETSFDKGTDKDKLLSNISEKNTTASGAQPILEHATFSNGVHVSTSIIKATVQNHMNTNIFQEIEVPNLTSKSQVLIEIDGSKQNHGYNPSPLIFTVAKIHTDNNKSKQMEPVQVTPVPISSIIEGGVVSTPDFGNITFKSTSVSGKEDKTRIIDEIKSICSPSNVAVKQNYATNNSIKSNAKSNELVQDHERSLADKNTGTISTVKSPTNIILPDLTKMADLKTVYSIGDIQKSSNITKEVIKPSTTRENIESIKKQVKSEARYENATNSIKNNEEQTTPTVINEQNYKTSFTPSVSSEKHNDKLGLRAKDVAKQPLDADTSTKSTTVTGQLKMTKTPSINRPLQRQKTTTVEPEQGQPKKITDKIEKQNIANQYSLVKTNSDKKSSNKVLVKSSFKSTDPNDLSNKRTATTHVTKTNTAASSTSIKSISKTPSTTSVSSSKSSIVSSTKNSTSVELPNKTVAKPLNMGGKSQVTAAQTKSSISSKPITTTQISKASTVSTIMSSSNLPQSSTKSPNVAKKTITGSVAKTTPTTSTEKQSTVSTMKTSSMKISNSSLGSKPAPSNSHAETSAAGNSTKNRQVSEQKATLSSKDIKPLT